MAFTLHPRLAADCFEIGRFPLCRVLLLNDARYKWFILVPQRDNIREVYELTQSEQIQLTRESSRFGKAVMALYGGDKLNIGALGNMVPQLHIHHIVRHEGDPAWPGAVWGHGEAVTYSDAELADLTAQMKALGLSEFSA